ncbi:MAG TPA: ammonium transporter [Pyrinomonadaceae bacterium]
MTFFIPALSKFTFAQEINIAERLTKLETAANTAQSNADNAWVLICAALVLLMTVPGLALFYSGLVRQKNVISTILQSLILAGVVTILWAIFGYSLAFSEGSTFLGSLDFAFLHNVGALPNADYAPTIPQQTFMIYQLMFAIITPALITGAFAERIKFSAMLAFTILWTSLIYLPLAHMVWGKGGFLNAALGGIFPALDFAGGTVVHISSGVSALVCALYVGKRLDTSDNTPHNIVLSVIGACLLWFGWFGFNAGSALSSGSLATNAFVTTHFAAASAMLAWTVIEWIRKGKPTVLGAISGVVAGLVGITPAAGFVTPAAALFIGLCAGFVCYFAVNELKHLLGYDDTLDVFGIHGIAGILGAVLTGVFATNLVNPIFKDANSNALPVGFIDGNAMQIVNQLVAVGLTILFAGAGSFVLLKIIDFAIGLRVSEEHEAIGLDASQHGETAYAFGINENMTIEISDASFDSLSVNSNPELAFEASE